jgi:agmatinase
MSVTRIYDSAYKMIFKLLYTTLLLVGAVRAREWEFPHAPSLPSAQNPLGRLSGGSDIDIEYGSQFHGLTTYGNIPYINCFSDKALEGTENNQYDIAILGAPFDTVRYPANR